MLSLYASSLSPTSAVGPRLDHNSSTWIRLQAGRGLHQMQREGWAEVLLCGDLVGSVEHEADVRVVAEGWVPVGVYRNESRREWREGWMSAGPCLEGGCLSGCVHSLPSLLLPLWLCALSSFSLAVWQLAA